MSEATFTVIYDGPALDNHRMEVRDLAPALLAFGDALTAAARIQSPNGPLPGLAISATEPGSFKVVLQITDPTLMSKIQDMLLSDGATAALNGVGLLSLVTVALSGVRWMWRKSVRAVEQDLPRVGWVRLTDSEGNTFEMPVQALSLARNFDFRTAANAIVEPLEEAEVETLEILAPEAEPAKQVKISYHDKAAYAVPELPEELVSDSTARTLVRLVNIAFRDGHKWKVSDGDLSYWVEIHDLSFLSRVQRAEERFTAGDVLTVILQTRQWATTTGPRTERAIIEVIDHRPGPRQVPLPFGDIGEIGADG